MCRLANASGKAAMLCIRRKTNHDRGRRP